MLINETAKLCNLTKKAVEYYTEQKMVSPAVLENGYRNYSEQDIETLRQIALYRKLGLSIFEIKSVLICPDEIKNILYKRTIELEHEKIRQDILKRLGDGESLESLEYEINSINSNSIIIKRLMDLFPSYYGKFIGLSFSRYLTGKIETKEQQEAFGEIIEFFDDASDIELPEDLQEYLDGHLNKYSGQDAQNMINEIIQTRDKSIENIDEFVKDNKEALDRYNEYRNTDEFKNSPSNRLMELLKEVCSSNGYYEKFIPAMRKLSPLYDEYYVELMRANEQFIKNYPEYVK